MIPSRYYGGRAGNKSLIAVSTWSRYTWIGSAQVWRR